MRLRTPGRSRSGVAAVEMGFIAPMLLIFVVGLWEVGRVIQIQNILDNAAREAGRLAASGAYFSSNNHVDPSTNQTVYLLKPSQNTDSTHVVDYELQKLVLLRLGASGVNITGAKVTVANVPRGWSYTWNQSGTGSGSGSDPAVFATQLDQLKVTITLPYSNVGWTFTSWFIPQSATLSGTCSWASVRDYPLSVSTTIPTKPLQPTDPLP